MLLQQVKLEKRINLIHLQECLLRVPHPTINTKYTSSFKPVNYLCSSVHIGGRSNSDHHIPVLPSANLGFLRDRSYRTLKHITVILKHTFFP